MPPRSQAPERPPRPAHPAAPAPGKAPRCPASRRPSHTSQAGTCRRHSSLHTTGTGRLTGSPLIGPRLPSQHAARHRSWHSPGSSRVPGRCRAEPGPGNDDPYAWMRDHDLPAMRAYLAAERAYYDRWQEWVRGLRGRARGRADRAGDPGRGVGQLAPRRDTPTSPGPCPVANSGSSAGPATAELRPGCCSTRKPPAGGPGLRGRLRRPRRPRGQPGRAAARLLRRGLRRRRALPAAHPRSGQRRGSGRADQRGAYYGLAWAADSRSLLYVVTDAQYRPHEVRPAPAGYRPRPGRPGVR